MEVKEEGEKKTEGAQRITGRAYIADAATLLIQFKEDGGRATRPKFVVAAKEVIWVGDQYKEGGVVFTDDLRNAVTECCEPKNVTELRRFMGFFWAGMFEAVPDSRTRTQLEPFPRHQGRAHFCPPRLLLGVSQDRDVSARGMVSGGEEGH